LVAPFRKERKCTAGVVELFARFRPSEKKTKGGKSAATPKWEEKLFHEVHAKGRGGDRRGKAAEKARRQSDGPKSRTKMHPSGTGGGSDVASYVGKKVEERAQGKSPRIEKKNDGCKFRKRG